MSKVVLQTDRGLELGEIISRAAAHNNKTCTISDERIDSYARQSGPNYPLSRDGRVVRLATVEDLNEQRHIDDTLKQKVLTEQGPGIVLDTLVLTQLVKVKLTGSDEVIALNVDELKIMPVPAHRS